MSQRIDDYSKYITDDTPRKRTYDEYQDADAEWTPESLSKIQTFYRGKYGRDLPVSNTGQTGHHKKLKLDHTGRSDIGLDPRTPEGREVTNFMRTNKMPFMAFDRAIPGASSGPHIHGGRPSPRLSNSNDDEYSKYITDDTDDVPQTPKTAPSKPLTKPKPIWKPRTKPFAPSGPFQRTTPERADIIRRAIDGGGVKEVGRRRERGGGLEGSTVPDVRSMLTEATNAYQRPFPAIPTPMDEVEAAPHAAQLAREEAGVRSKVTADMARQRERDEYQGYRYTAPPPKGALDAEVARRVADEHETQAKYREQLSRLTPDDLSEIQTMFMAAGGATQGGPLRSGIIGTHRVTSGMLTKVAGILDAINIGERHTGGLVTGAIPAAGGLTSPLHSLAEYLRRQAFKSDLTVEELHAAMPPNVAEQAAEFVTQTIGALPEIYAATAVGGYVGGFGALGFAEAVGQKESLGGVAAGTAEGAALGKVFSAGGKAVKPITPGMNQLGQRIANVVRPTPIIAGGTYGVEKVFGKENDEALLSAATNALFHVTSAGLREGFGKRAPTVPPLSSPSKGQKQQGWWDEQQGRVQSQLLNARDELRAATTIEQYREAKTEVQRLEGIFQRIAAQRPVAVEEQTGLAADLQAKGVQVTSEPGEKPRIRPTADQLAVAQKPIVTEAPEPDIVNEVVAGMREKISAQAGSKKARTPKPATPIPAESLPQGAAPQVQSTAPLPPPERLAERAKEDEVFDREERRKSGETGKRAVMYTPEQRLAALEALGAPPIELGQIAEPRSRMVDRWAARLLESGAPESQVTAVVNSFRSGAQTREQAIETFKMMAEERRIAAPPADHSTTQARRVRNVKTGAKGQFKKGGVTGAKTTEVIGTEAMQLPVLSEGTGLGKTSPKPKVKKGKKQGGFLNVTEVNNALSDLKRRFTDRTDRELRGMLMRENKELFKYASSEERVRWLNGQIVGPANSASTSSVESGVEQLGDVETERLKPGVYDTARMLTKASDFARRQSGEFEWGQRREKILEGSDTPLKQYTTMFRGLKADFPDWTTNEIHNEIRTKYPEMASQVDPAEVGAIDLTAKTVDESPVGAIHRQGEEARVETRQKFADLGERMHQRINERLGPESEIAKKIKSGFGTTPKTEQQKQRDTRRADYATMDTARLRKLRAKYTAQNRVIGRTGRFTENQAEIGEMISALTYELNSREGRASMAKHKAREAVVKAAKDAKEDARNRELDALPIPDDVMAKAHKDVANLSRQWEPVTVTPTKRSYVLSFSNSDGWASHFDIYPAGKPVKLYRNYILVPAASRKIADAIARRLSEHPEAVFSTERMEKAENDPSAARNFIEKMRGEKVLDEEAQNLGDVDAPKKKSGEEGFLNVGDIAKAARELYDKFGARHGTEPREAISIIRGELRPGSSVSRQGGRDYEGYSVTLEFGDTARGTPYSSPLGPTMHTGAETTRRGMRDIKRVMFDAEQFITREDAQQYHSEIRKALDETGRKDVPIEGVKYNEDADRYTYGGKVRFDNIRTYQESVDRAGSKELVRLRTDATDAYFEALDSNNKQGMDKWEKRIGAIEDAEARKAAETKEADRIAKFAQGKGSIDAPATEIELPGGKISARRPDTPAPDERIVPAQHIPRAPQPKAEPRETLPVPRFTKRTGPTSNRPVKIVKKPEASPRVTSIEELRALGDSNDPATQLKARRLLGQLKLTSKEKVNYWNMLYAGKGEGGFLNIGDVGNVVREMRRRMKETGPIMALASGTVDITKYPKGGKTDLAKISYWVEPAVEKLWVEANRLVERKKLKAEEMRPYVIDKFAAAMDAKENSDIHVLWRMAAKAGAAKRLSQIAGPTPEEKKMDAKTLEGRRTELNKKVALWLSFDKMTDAQIHALAKQKFSEAYRTDPVNALDRLYRQIMPNVRKKTAETWQEEVMNRLNTEEKFLDAQVAKLAAAEPTAAEQAKALGGKAKPVTTDATGTEGGEEVNKLWEALAESGRTAGVHTGRTPEHIPEWHANADKLIRDFGIEAAQKWYDNAKPGGIRTVVGRKLGDYYQIEAVRTGNQELLAKSIEFANERVLESVELGRAVKAFDDPEYKLSLGGALEEATRLYRQSVADNPKAATTKLPANIAKKVNEQAVARDKAKKKVKDLEAKVESEPELPPAERKVKIVKKSARKPDQDGSTILGMGLGGLQAKLEVPPEVAAAKQRKADAAKTMKLLEKQFGKYWTKASHPLLEVARVELNQTTYDLAITLRALEQRRQGYGRRLFNLTRSLMVSSFPTASRNAQTQNIRSGVERVTDAFEMVLRKSLRMDTDFQAKDILKNYARQFHPSAKRYATHILGAHPGELLRIFATYSGGVEITLPNKMAKGMDKVFGGVERFAYHANVFNRMQEFHIRSAEFLAELELHTKKATGLTLEEFVAKRGADKLPTELISGAVDKALAVTFAANPTNKTRTGRALNQVIEFGSGLPPTISPIPFPRFMYNSMKFLYQYNPVPINVVHQAVRGGNWQRAIAQQVIGAGMLTLAYQIRDDERIAGEKWYEIKTRFGTLDTRPFGPFSTYLLFAEAIRRHRRGERNFTWKEWVAGLGASTSPGGISIASAERLYGYYEKGDYDKLMKVFKTEVGDLARAALTPIRQSKDIIAQFDESQRVTKNTDSQPILGPIRESIPYASKTLPDAHRPTSARPVQQENPLGKFVTGFRKVSPKNLIEREIDRLHFRPSEVRHYTGDRTLDNAITKHMGPEVDVQSAELENDPRFSKASDAVKFVLVRAALKGAYKTALSKAADDHPEEFIKYKSRVPYWKQLLRNDKAAEESATPAP